MNKQTRLGLVLCGAVALAACGGKGGVAGGDDNSFDPAGSNGNTAGATTGGAETTPIGDAQPWTLDPLNHPDSPLQSRVMYFDFDDASLTMESRLIAEAHAKYLAENLDQKVVLDGHADERGTREYNIALGQQRAEAVRRLMLLFGVSPTQLSVLSYGEEKPAVFGHDERSWALNRRVEIRYQ